MYQTELNMVKRRWKAREQLKRIVSYDLRFLACVIIGGLAVPNTDLFPIAIMFGVFLFYLSFAKWLVRG